MEGLPDLIKAFVDQHPLLAEHFPYLLVFGLLYLSGVGLPLPEEPTLILGGYLVYLQSVGVPNASLRWPLARMIAMSCVGILAGDLTVYWLGRRYGQAFMTHRATRWIFSKQNRGRIERFYERFGLWAVFVSRFVAGIRVGSFFLAGASRVRLRSFLLMDGLGILISVPVSVWLACHFGEEIHLALQWLGQVTRNLAMGIALVSLCILWWQIRRARKGIPNTGP
jgi:membrane protein DedA with SNARE-associated domain